MKPCRKLLDVMYEQRANAMNLLNELDGPIASEDKDIHRAKMFERKHALATIDHIIDAYIETWQT